ncbi:MAG: glycosyl transferase family 1 [Patescibacteria group bacterium]|nr:MAG: glycosyl transferase family 1 [Patescibacteria group bacterium]
MKLHIAIDGNEANVLNRVGSNVYAFEILVQLEQLVRRNEDITVTVLLASPKITDLPDERKGWDYKVIKPEKFWTQWALPIHLYKNQKKYDVFYTPGHYAPRLCPIPYISSVMDTAYLAYPEQFKKSDTIKLTKWTQYSVKHAKKVIAISKFTKDEIVTHYGKNPDDIVVAYPSAAIQKLHYEPSQVNTFFRKHTITEPYFLFVGTMQPRKNLERLIEAFEIYYRMDAGRSLQKKNAKSNRTNQKPKLVIAGKVGWLAEPIVKRIADSNIKNRIITTGFISDIEKQILYQHATASCLVGLYEGFGIPPLESLYFNTVPIVSNTTSLPEVVGEAGLYANPTNPQEIADQMWKAQNLSTVERRSFRRLAREQIKKFSWKLSAETILTTLITTAQELQNKKGADAGKE